MTDVPAWTSLLLHGGFALFLAAFVLRDILWLRLVTVCGYVLFAALALIRGGSSLVELLPWYVAFMTINLVQIALLVRERWLIKMSPAEAELWSAHFPVLDPVVFKRLLRVGQQRSLSEGFAITSEGRHTLRLYLVISGAVDVTLEGQPVTRLGPGEFVGEIGFISNSPATATAIAAGGEEGAAAGTCCVVWNVPKLRKLMARDGELRNVVFAAIGADLAQKVAEQTVTMRRRPAVPQPSEGAADQQLAVVPLEAARGG